MPIDMSRLYIPFKMPVAFEGIFRARTQKKDTVSRATTPTTMPECTDAPAQSFGSKRPRKETGDVLANIQNANIRKATPGGNIDAVRFEGGSQESVAKRTRRTTRSQGKENPDAHVLVDLTGEEDVIDMTLDTSPAAETDDAAAEAADAAAEIPPETSGPDDAPAASTEETEAGSPGAPIQPPETWFCRDTNRWLPVTDVPFDTESQPSYLGYFLRIREKTDSPWRHAVVCDAHLQSEIDKNDADDVFERVEVPDGRYDLMFGVWRDAEAASRAKVSLFLIFARWAIGMTSCFVNRLRLRRASTNRTRWTSW